MKSIQLAKRFVREDWGGAETVILETSKRLLDAGHQTEVFCTMATAENETDNVEGLMVRRFPYFYPYLGLKEESKELLDRKGGSPFSFRLMNALNSESNLELIHLHMAGRLGGIGRHIAKKRNIPYVVSLHGGIFDVPEEDTHDWTDPTKGALDWGKLLGWWVGARRVLDDASAVLCVGKGEQILMQKYLPNNRVVYTPNGVDLERFVHGDGDAFRSSFGIPSDAFVVTTVARIDSQKNQKFAVQALPKILAGHPKVHLLFVGPVTNQFYLQTLEELIETNRLGGNVTIVPGLAGGSEDLVNAYHASDAFLLPSVHEPFGIAVLEAWVSGLPVLASDVGGIPHFVEDGKDGYLFRSNDEEHFLEAFEKLMADPDKSRAMADAGGQKARNHYSWDAVTNSLAAIYEEVTSESPIRK